MRRLWFPDPSWGGRASRRLEPAAAPGEGETYPGMNGNAQLRVQNGADRTFSFELTYTTADYRACKGEDGVAVFTYKLTEVAPEGVDALNYDPATSILYSRQTYWVRVKLGLDEAGRLAILKREVFEDDPGQ